MWMIGIIVAFLMVAILVFLQQAGGLNFPWLQFYVKGKESGFKFSEINLLRRVAVENKTKDPMVLFWSEKQLDQCIKSIILKQRSKNTENDETSVGFINKLFEFRKRIEFNRPKYRVGLKTTRNISPGQILKITLQEGSQGVFTAQVVENMRRYIAVSYPKGRAIAPGFSWKGQGIRVYFWRKEDAGYYFESKVIGDYLHRQYPILHLEHVDKLLRTQKRNSIRAPINKRAHLYPFRTIQNANENPEKLPGYKTKLIDISEGGAAIMIGGKAKLGLPVKLQFRLYGSPIVMCGTVKGITYNEKSNTSILHIESVPLSISTRNRILMYAYDIFPEEQKDARQSKSASHEQNEDSVKSEQKKEEKH